MIINSDVLSGKLMNNIKINKTMKEIENLYIRKHFGKLKEIFIDEKKLEKEEW